MPRRAGLRSDMMDDALGFRFVAYRSENARAMEMPHGLPGDQPAKEVHLVRRAVAAEGRRRNERLPIQNRETARRLHLARSQGDRRDVPGRRGRAEDRFSRWRGAFIGGGEGYPVLRERKR